LVTSQYRAVRKGAGLRVDTVARRALHDGTSIPGISAVRSPTLVAEVERLIRRTMADCQDWVASELGMAIEIGVRLDWTWRTETARQPRSRGGMYTSVFRNLDADDGEIFVGPRGPGISLRLARYISAQTDNLNAPGSWPEYNPIHLHPVIGGRVNITKAEQLRLLVAHECSHAAVFAAVPHPIAFPRLVHLARDWRRAGLYVRVGADQAFSGDHESAWQSVYGKMRQDLGLNSAGDLAPVETAKPGALGSLHLRPGEQWGGRKYTCQMCEAECVTTAVHPRGGGRTPRFCSGSCRAKFSRIKATQKAEVMV